MNALADAAFMTSSESNNGQYSNGGGYTDAELRAFGAMSMPPGMLQTQCLSANGSGMANMSNGNSQCMISARNLVTSSQLPGPGRHLQILDHTVHRIDAHTKASGEEEKEMVVSNLRHFTLKIGVLDPRMGMGRETELPLKAELLYENGQLVEQLATCEPLLVGKTEVVAMQGTALFKLRITSLSSHRDKQRFRIRVSPVDINLLVREPGLSVVTTPMKCVTKLSHRSSTTKIEVGEGEGEEWDEENKDTSNGVKRKRDDNMDPILEAQGQQLQRLHDTNMEILQELQSLKQLLERVAPKTEPVS